MGSSDCGTTLGKYFLCLFNFIFFLLGSLILGVGLWLIINKRSLIALLKLVDNEHVKEFTDPELLQQASYLIIAAGAIMFLLSFLGYCGALRESPCLLTTYGVLMVVILILELAAGLLVLFYADKVEEHTRTFLSSTLKDYNPEEASAVTVAWDKMMQGMNCCGIDGYKDFYTPTTAKTPEACCKYGFDCDDGHNIANSNFKTGCLGVVQATLSANTLLLVGAGIGLAVLQLVLIVIAFCLSKAVERYLK